MLTGFPYDVLNKVPFTRFDGVKGSKLYLINTKVEWDAFFGLLMQRKIVACDTETTGFRYYENDRIVGMSFGWDETHFYIPVRHEDSVSGGAQPPQLSMEDLREDLQTFFAQKDVFTLWHNWKFDAHFFRADGIEILTPFHDTRILWQLYNENAPGKLKMIASGWVDEMGRKQKGLIGPEANEKEKEVSAWRGGEAKARRKVYKEAVIEETEKRVHDLEHQGKNKTQLKQWVKDHLLKDHPYASVAKDDIHYGFVPIELMVEYAATDTFLTYKLYEHVIENLPMGPKLQGVYVNEIKLSRVLMEAEEHGVKIDRKYLEDLKLSLEKEEIELLKKIKEQLGNINLNSNDQLAKALVDVGVPLTKKTATGKLAVDKQVLEGLDGDYVVISDILLLRQLEKIKNTYVIGILDKLTPDDILHCSFNQNVSTGRMCIAEGTPVQMPCDRSKYPNGKPIENIKRDDYVYCYDEEGNLHLRKVVWAGCKGTKKTLTIKWRGQGGKHEGELTLTPDHRVRLFDGTWVEAQQLKPNDRIMALSARAKGVSTDRYTYLYGRYSSAFREHVFVYNQLKGDAEVVHHVDHNKLNNELDNLLGQTRVDHAVSHVKDVPAAVLKTRARYLQTVEARRNCKAAMKKGVEHHSWKDIPKITLLRWAAVGKGHIRSIMALSGMDFNCLKRKYELAGIDLAFVRKRYNKNGVYLSRKLVREASELGFSRGYKHLNVGYYTFKDLLRFYDLEQNHVVVSVTEGSEVPVYDLEVEEFNNFIASELCVHNSSQDPNLQNIPGRDDRIRKAFINLNEDYVYVLADYSQIEVRLTAHYSKDPLLLDAYKRGQDVHTRTMCEMFGFDYEEVKEALKDESHPRYAEWDNLRTIAKRINFGIIYGVGAPGLSGQIPRPEHYKDLSTQQWIDVCQKYIDQYMQKYIGVKRLINSSGREVRKNAKVTNHFGRIRRLPHARADKIKGEGYFWMVGRAKRQGTNFIIQGCQDPAAPVLTEDGYIPIKDLEKQGKPGLLTYSGLERNYDVLDTGEKDCVEVETTVSTGICSTEHKFFVYDSSVQDLVFKGINELSVGDCVVADFSRSPEGRIANVSEAEAELLGALIGDGYFGPLHTYSSGRIKKPILRNQLSICVSKKYPEYKDRLVNLWKCSFPQANVRLEDKRTKWNVVVESKVIRQRFLDLGLERVVGSSKCVPSWVLVSPAPIRQAVLRGLLDTDGGINGRTIGFVNKSEDVVRKTQLLLASEKISSRFDKTKEGYFRLVIPVEHLESLIYIMSIKHKKEHAGVNYKQHNNTTRDYLPVDLVRDACESIIPYVNSLSLSDSEKVMLYRRSMSKSKLRFMLENLKGKSDTLANMYDLVERSWAKIERVTSVGCMHTMDLELYGDDHSYICRGLVQHNTAADVFKIAVVRTHEILKGTKSFIVNFVHDEIQMYVHKDELHLLNKVRDAMEDFDFDVPVIADFAYSKTSWADKKKL